MKIYCSPSKITCGITHYICMSLNKFGCESTLSRNTAQLISYSWIIYETVFNILIIKIFEKFMKNSQVLRKLFPLHDDDAIPLYQHTVQSKGLMSVYSNITPAQINPFTLYDYKVCWFCVAYKKLIMLQCRQITQHVQCSVCCVLYRIA